MADISPFLTSASEPSLLYAERLANAVAFAAQMGNYPGDVPETSMYVES